MGLVGSAAGLTLDHAGRWRPASGISARGRIVQSGSAAPARNAAGVARAGRPARALLHCRHAIRSLPVRPFAPAADGQARHNLVSLRRLFWLRWALLSAQATMLLTCEALAGVILPYRPLLIIFALQTLFNLMTGLRLHLHSSDDAAPSDAELMGQLMVDLTALSAILFFTGGATNPFVSFYLPGLAIAAAILPWRMVMALALFALACYSVLLLEYVPLNLINPDNAVNYHSGTGMG